MKYSHFITVLIIFVFLPWLSEACPMCQGGEGFSKDSIYAYKLTTAFLASLPILMGVGIFWWVKRKLQKAQ